MTTSSVPSGAALSADDSSKRARTWLADRQCVVERLQGEGVLVHAGDAERCGHRAGGDDERVVLQRVAWLGEDQLAVEVEADDTSHADGDVALATEDAAHRVADVVAVEPRRGHLVQQRLERVEVVGVDDRHVHRRVAQPPSDGQPTEAGPDDHDALASHAAPYWRAYCRPVASGFTGNVAAFRHTVAKEPNTMAVRLGDTAPDFTAPTTEGEINFHDWLGDSWGVLFSHPKDFTPVCTTELGYLARIKPEFDKRNVKVIGLSVDPVDSHAKWADDIAETQGTAVNFPMIGDPERKVADLYDMIHPNASDTMTVRSVFVIGPDKKVKLTITYPAATGRNFDELLRVIDSLQLTAGYKVATPANWQDGDDVIIGSAVTDDEAKQLFPQGWTAVKPYLRVLPQPNK